MLRLGGLHCLRVGCVHGCLVETRGWRRRILARQPALRLLLCCLLLDGVLPLVELRVLVWYRILDKVYPIMGRAVLLVVRCVSIIIPPAPGRVVAVYAAACLGVVLQVGVVEVTDVWELIFIFGVRDSLATMLAGFWDLRWIIVIRWCDADGVVARTWRAPGRRLAGVHR